MSERLAGHHRNIGRLPKHDNFHFDRVSWPCDGHKCPSCYGRTSQESFEKMVKDFGQWNVTWLIVDGSKGRRRRRATFDQTVIRGSEPHDMIRRGNIFSTKRASDSNPKQGQNSKMARRMDQTFSVNRLADGPCRQSSFLSSMV